MTQPLFPRRRFRAILFDMDDTILSSIAATERVWGAWARRHGLDVEAFLPTIHGMRAIETMQRLNLPGLDLAEEVRAVERGEIEDLEGIEAIAGIAALHRHPMETPHPSIAGFETLQVKLAVDGGLDIVMALAINA